MTRNEARSFVVEDALGENAALGEQFNEPAFIPQDDLKKNFDAFVANFDDILSQTVELFDLEESWEATHKDSVRRLGTELLKGEDKASVFEYKPENAINAVREVLALPYRQNLIYQHKPSNGEPLVEIFGLTAGRYTGEAVELDGRIIHLVLLEMA